MINKFVKIQAQVLALVAWSNGNFETKERKFFINFLNTLEIPKELFKELNNYLSKPPDKEDVLNSLNKFPHEYALTTVKNAYLMAKSNDDISNEERQMIKEIGSSLKLQDQNVPKYFEMLEKYYEVFLLEKELF